MSPATTRRLRRGGAIACAVIAILLIVVAAFPWGILRGTFERALTQRFGRPVTIASLERVDHFGFTPTIAVRGLSIPQPRWAGTGDFARLAEARATFSLWPLLTGRVEPRDIRVRGLRLALVRTKDGQTNWARPGKPGQGNSATDIGALTIADSMIVYRDAKRDRTLSAAITSDAVHGVRAAGHGVVRGAPVTLSLVAPPIATHHSAPWPFTARLDGPDLAMTATGTMDRPLDTDAMTLDVTARAHSLKLVDAVIEAGLFGTQPVRLAAHVRHDAPTWRVTALKGTIGISALTGHVTATKQDGRTKLDGAVDASRLAFEDLSDDEGLARGRALEARIGKRLVPNTKIDLSHMRHTDGTIAVHVARIVSRDGKPSSLASLSGTLTLDHAVLTVKPFALGLTQGTITGDARIVQGERPVPTLTLNLWLRGASIAALAGGKGDFTGHVTAHARLTGAGPTIRAAVGHGDGSIGLVARDGILPARLADALGFDAARAFFAGEDDKAGLRCVILHLTMKNGHGAISPMIVDTTQSQLHGTGSVTFPDEALAIRLTGAPKQGSILRLPGSATMTGTIQNPHVSVPPQVKSVGNILKAIGHAITGDQGPEAGNADCAALAARALR